MAGFLRFVGWILLLLFIATIFYGRDIQGFFPNDYKSLSDDLINNKWLLLVLSIILSMAGSITNVAKRIKKKKTEARVSYKKTKRILQDDSDVLSKKSALESLAASFSEVAATKQSSIKQGYKYKANTNTFMNGQQGRLKDIAMKVDWKPLRSGGANFKTSELKQINSTRLEVKKSKGGYLFAGMFAAVGFGTMIFGSSVLLQKEDVTFELLIPLLFGGIFAAVGIAMLVFPRPRVFDRRTGWFWSGNKSLAREQDFMKLKKSARLSDIAAIQIIDEHVSRSKGGSYRSWEINLVSEDGQRMNVMDHGKKESILADAQKLSEFLGVPIWENG